MNFVGRLRCVRALATFNGPVGVQASEQSVRAFLQAPPTTQSLRAALMACADIEAAYRASARPDYHELPAQRDPGDARALLAQVLGKYAAAPPSPCLRITNQTLLDYFTNSHPPSTAASLQVLQAFSASASTAVVPEPIAMIPFRRAVYQADFRGALDVMDHTCGAKSNYRTRMARRLLRLAAAWGVATGAALTGVYTALTSGQLGDWQPGTAAMICGMFGTYFAALTLYGAMTLAGSKSGLGLVLEWVPGTSPLYRYYHSQQLKMATFVTELNRSLPENLGELSPQLRQDLRSLNLRPVESQSEAHLKEYWARGGAGFDWIEPDQDPSELLWTEHMEASRQQRLGSAYSRRDRDGKLLSWMGEVEKEKAGRSIPHASLLGVDELRQQLGTPAGMLSFEQELQQDMQRIAQDQKRQIEAGPAAAELESSESEDAARTSCENAGESSEKKELGDKAESSGKTEFGSKAGESGNPGDTPSHEAEQNKDDQGKR